MRETGVVKGGRGMVVFIGPYCPICGGREVVKERVWGVTAWASTGPIFGWLWRNRCTKCGATSQ